MGKSSSLCIFEKCKKPRNARDCYCKIHGRKATISRFLGQLYSHMEERVRGKTTRNPHLYLGKAIMPRDVFLNWSKNHPDFLKLYKRWYSNDFDRRLTPSVNRKNSTKGYTLDNVEWLTNSQNCSLGGLVQNMKLKKEIYNLLGVNNVKK